MKTKLEIKEIVVDKNELTGNKEGYITANLTLLNSDRIISITVYSDKSCTAIPNHGIFFTKTDNSIIELNELYLFILLKIKMLKKNSTFTIKELFMEHQWHKILMSDKRKLGMMFKKYVDNGLISEVKFESVDSNKTRHYKKIK